MYTCETSQPTKCRADSNWSERTTIGYASVASLPGTRRLWSVVGRDGKRGFSLEAPTNLAQVQIEKSEMYVWTEAAPGRIRIYGCSSPDGTDVFLDRDPKKVCSIYVSRVMTYGCKECGFYMYEPAALSRGGSTPIVLPAQNTTTLDNASKTRERASQSPINPSRHGSRNRSSTAWPMHQGTSSINPSRHGSTNQPAVEEKQDKRIPDSPIRHVSEFGEQVERAIREGVRYLKQEQRADGSWDDASPQAKTGTTSLVTLALLAAGEKPDSSSIRKALSHLRRFGPEDLGSTYAIALQTMVFAAAEPERDQLRIAVNAAWLESAQIKARDPVPWPGSWTYSSSKRSQSGDNSNTQYALLGLNAASEVGVPVRPEVWALARLYWEKTQLRDGGWGYHAGDPLATSSMTCAGISSLVITGSKRFQGAEYLQGALIHNCGQGAANLNLQHGIDWLASRFSVGQNFPAGQQWKLYYLYGLERAGRLAGIRFFGQHDWYRLGADELVHSQDRLGGFWRGATENEIIATSFAILFLAKGRAPVLV